MALFFTISILCFTACPFALAIGDQMDISYNFQDIMAGINQIRNIDMEDHIKKHEEQLKQLQNLFVDSSSQFEASKATAPWKMLLEGIPRFSDQKHRISSSLDSCQGSLADVATALMKNESWAKQMIDAMGKPGSGIMDLNLLWLGSFSQCKDVIAYHRQLDNITIKGQYCIATFLPPGPPKQLIPGLGLPLSINVGLCIPNTCSQEDIQSVLNSAVGFLTGGKIRVAISNYQPESIPLTTQAIAVISLLSVIGFVILLGTLYDVCLHQPALEKAKSSVITVMGRINDNPTVRDEDRPLNVEDYVPLLRERQEQTDAQPDQRSVPMRILLALSIYSNAKKILSTKRIPGSLDCVHGIRFLSMTWVILGHTLFFLINYLNNTRRVLLWTRHWTFQAIMNASVSVDSFFVLSGTLVSYLLLKQLKLKNGPRNINWALFYFHRFWRLTPAYMLILGIEVALYTYLGNGPVWPSATGIDPNCKESWWTNLLYVNNLVKTDKICFGWAWYLANDMQFFVISPIIILAFYYKWFAGAIVSTIFILINFGSVAGIVMDKNETGASSFMDIYIKPWARIGPYIVGVVTGYLLHITERNRPRIHTGLVWLGWALAAACNLAVLYGLYEYNSGKAIESRGVNAFYQACSRTAWGLGLAWVIFACCRGYGGFVNTLLSWQGIIPLSRLTYTAYLVHPIILYYFNTSLRQTLYFNEIVYIWIFLGGLAVSYGMAFITSLAFEAPMMGLEKVVFPRN